MTKMELLKSTLREEVIQLRKWAVEAKAGGWSTNLVTPMRKRADFIEETLHSCGGKDES